MDQQDPFYDYGAEEYHDYRRRDAARSRGEEDE
jgi:hypothetical protein